VTTVVEDFIEKQLVERRHRLERAVAAGGTNRARRLLEDVDAALERFENGTYGICDVCHESVESDRLIADPLVRVCLDHLSSVERSALEQDLELAAQVQRGLLPPPNVTSGGWQVSYHYEPASVVSGDYCDVVDGGEAGLYFMLGDVSGKGVAASMLTAHLHAMFRSLISVKMPLKSIVEHASRVFAESTLPTHYATLVVGRALPNGAVEVCNAGHPYPLVIRKHGVSELETSGLPVGLFRDEEFSVQELRLEYGESLLSYSDGVSEAVDGAGSEYGAARLRGLLRGSYRATPEDLIAACNADVNRFRNGAPKADDLTILALARS